MATFDLLRVDFPDLVLSVEVSFASAPTVRVKFSIPDGSFIPLQLGHFTGSSTIRAFPVLEITFPETMSHSKKTLFRTLQSPAQHDSQIARTLLQWAPLKYRESLYCLKARRRWQFFYSICSESWTQ